MGRRHTLTDRLAARPLHESKNLSNDHGGVVLAGGYIYGSADGRGWVCQNHDLLICFDLKGVASAR